MYFIVLGINEKVNSSFLINAEGFVHFFDTTDEAREFMQAEYPDKHYTICKSIWSH